MYIQIQHTKIRLLIYKMQFYLISYQVFRLPFDALLIFLTYTPAFYRLIAQDNHK